MRFFQTNRRLHKENIKLAKSLRKNHCVTVSFLFVFPVETKICIGTLQGLRFMGHNVVSRAPKLQEGPAHYEKTEPPRGETPSAHAEPTDRWGEPTQSYKKETSPACAFSVAPDGGMTSR